MKKVKKLTLSKETFAVLTNDEQFSVKGGVVTNGLYSCNCMTVNCIPTHNEDCITIGCGTETCMCPVSGAGGSMDNKCDLNLFSGCGSATAYGCGPEDEF